MNDQQITPHKVTKPIQLLAAWLVGLVLTNVSFLEAAIRLGGGWEQRALVIAAILNVPLFLLALFVLQTRFRAELQEDTYYAEYLSKKTSGVLRIEKVGVQEARIERLESTVALITSKRSHEAESTLVSVDDEHLDWSRWRIALNQNHPNFTAVRTALRQAEVPLTDIFGAAQRVPTQWIVAVSYELPLANKMLLLRTILPLGFDGFQLWFPHREADETEDVYIGSYGGGSYVKTSEDFLKLLDSDIEPIDFEFYYQSNETEVPKHEV